MQTIAQILQSLKDLSSSIFFFNTNIEPLSMLDAISPSLTSKLESNEFNSLIENASKSVEALNAYIQPLMPEIKRNINVAHNYRKKDSTIPYADFKIDLPQPLIHTKYPKQLSFDDIQSQRTKDGFKKITPVRHRSDFKFEGCCPFCGAESNYIYLNNGKDQYKCKVCKNPFTTKTTVSDSSAFFCPHCDHQLSLHHDRKNYEVYVCPNKKCSYYKQNFAKLSTQERRELKTSSNQYKLRYTYRAFNFNVDDLKQVCDDSQTKVNLSKIFYSPTVLGLVLTYYVNYGLSARKTALILNEVHGISISHQTILNYANSVSALLKPYLDSMKYETLSSIQSGDETYIKVRGKNQYVFFFSDPKKKIITSYTIYSTRDTKNACQAIYDSMQHYKELPDDLLYITDGNPIYNVAQLFFEMNGTKFDLKQVIGVSNKDETSKQYRPYKQVEERLNRTYKMNYYGTNGYDKLETANVYMVLYVAFFNFFRKHSALHHKVPYELNGIDHEERIQNKWIQLIKLATDFRFAETEPIAA